MGKLLAFLLGLAALSYAAYYYLDTGMKGGGASAVSGQVEGPLQHVRGEAKQIEKDAQKRADDVNARTAE